MARTKTNDGWKQWMRKLTSAPAGAGGTCSSIIQFVAVLWPPFYNAAEPAWAGIPFFYWYQMLWVVIAAVLTAIVYFATED